MDVFAEFERNLVPFKKLVREALEAVETERACTHCLAHDGREAALRAAVRVLLTGAAGFIGARTWAALQAAGHEVVAVDAMLPAAHGPGAEPPPQCHVVDIRDGSALAPLLAGVDVVCHQAAVVGAGVNAADAPSYAGAERLRDGGVARRDVRRRLHAPGVGLVDGGVRAGRLRLP